MPLLRPPDLLQPPRRGRRALCRSGVFLNPAGNAGIGAYRIAITPPELVGRVQSVSQFAARRCRSHPSLAGALLAAARRPGRRWPSLVALTARVALIPTLSRSVRRYPRPAEWVTQASTGTRGPARELAGAANV